MEKENVRIEIDGPAVEALLCPWAASGPRLVIGGPEAVHGHSKAPGWWALNEDEETASSILLYVSIQRCGTNSGHCWLIFDLLHDVMIMKCAIHVCNTTAST